MEGLNDLLITAGAAVWRASWQGAVLVGVVLLARGLLAGRLSARWRYSLWLLVVARLSIPTPLESPVSLYGPLSRRPAPAKGVEPEPVSAATVAPRVDPSARAPAALEPVFEPAAAAPVLPEVGGAAAPATVPLAVRTAGSERAARFALEWPMVLGWVWVLGMAVLAGRVLVGSLGVRRAVRRAQPVHEPELLGVLASSCRQMGVRRRIEAFETGAVESPALYGLWRLRLLLPRGLTARCSPEELRYLILHELAHVKRGDLAMNWVVTGLQILHWYNPVLWFGFGRMRADRELACDERALEVAGEGAARPYGLTLVKLLEGCRAVSAPPGAVGILEDGSFIRRRLAWILEFRRRPRWSPLAVGLMAVLAVVGLTDARRGDSGEGTGAMRTVALPDDAAWHLERTATDRRALGAFWSALPRGEQAFGAVRFRVREPVWLGAEARAWEDGAYRERLELKSDEGRFRRLHLLHATRLRARPGTEVGRVTLHYGDGGRRDLPIVYGQHVRSFWRSGYDLPPRVGDLDSKAIRLGAAPEGGETDPIARIYRTTLANPRPRAAVASVELAGLIEDLPWLVAGLTLDDAVTFADESPDADLGGNAAAPGKAVVLKVVDEQSGEPLEGATVAVAFTQEGEEAPQAEWVTDADGSCRVGLRERGPQWFHLKASVGGYTPVKQFVTGTPTDGGAEPSLPLEVTVPLPRAARTGGVILDKLGQPVAGAHVRLEVPVREPNPGKPSADLSGSAVETDAQGRWHCDVLPARCPLAELTVTHPDYVLVPPQAAHPYALVDAEELRSGSARTVLTPAVRLAGRITDEQGRPVIGVRVVLSESTRLESMRPVYGTALTGSDGTYRFPYGWQGRTVLTAMAQGYAPAIAVAEPPGGPGPFDFVLSPGATLRGRVVGAEGLALGGVSVRVQKWRGIDVLPPDIWLSVTDAEGRFAWTNAPTEPVGLWFIGQGVSMRVELEPAGEEQVIDLGPRLRIAGRILDDLTGDPIPKAILRWGHRVEWPGPGTGAGTSVPGYASGAPSAGQPAPPNLWGARPERAEGGRYQLHIGLGNDSILRMPAARVLLRVEAEGFQAAISPPFNAAEGNIEWDARLKKAPLRVRIRRPDGQPLPNGTVCVWEDGVFVGGSLHNGMVRSRGLQPGISAVVTDATGLCTLASLVGPYCLSVTEADGYAGLASTAITDGMDIALEPWAAIEGQVWCGRRPLGPCRVWFSARHRIGESQGQQMTYFSSTDSEGRFRLERVPPGATDSFSVRLDFDWEAVPEGPSLNLAPGERKQMRLAVAGRAIRGMFRLPPSGQPGGQGLRAEYNLYLKRPIAEGLGSVMRSELRLESEAAPTKLDRLKIHQYAVAKYSGPLAVGTDGAFQIEAVPVGDYWGEFTFTEAGAAAESGSAAPVVGEAGVAFQVPTVEANKDASPVDLGAVPVQIAEAR